MHRLIVHNIVCLVSAPVLITLLDGCDGDDKEQRQTTRYGACGGIDDHLNKEDHKEVHIPNSSELFKQVLGNKVPNGVLG